ncbi:MAG TPA: hypothetical protein VFM97_00450 [Gammaproteobacteria bacterium]|nr:hypothetical protein [Gammaproteobacteria bacterium]
MTVELFTCPRHAGNLRLMPSSCAAMWNKAQRAEPDDRLFPCRGCEIGARHAGHAPEDAHGRLPAESICARCHRSPRRFIDGRICVSCYNRGREWKLGRNAKGRPPVHLPALYTARIATVERRARREIIVPNVANTLEAVLSLAHQARKPLKFTRAPGLALVRAA